MLSRHVFSALKFCLAVVFVSDADLCGMIILLRNSVSADRGINQVPLLLVTTVIETKKMNWFEQEQGMNRRPSACAADDITIRLS